MLESQGSHSVYRKSQEEVRVCQVNKNQAINSESYQIQYVARSRPISTTKQRYLW